MTTGTDANWLRGLIELEVRTTGAYAARQQADVLTTDITRFVDELRKLDEQLTGEAVREALSRLHALMTAFPVRSNPDE